MNFNHADHLGIGRLNLGYKEKVENYSYNELELKVKTTCEKIKMRMNYLNEKIRKAVNELFCTVNIVKDKVDTAITKASLEAKENLRKNGLNPSQHLFTVQKVPRNFGNLIENNDNNPNINVTSICKPINNIKSESFDIECFFSKSMNENANGRLIEDGINEEIYHNINSLIPKEEYAHTSLFKFSNEIKDENESMSMDEEGQSCSYPYQKPAINGNPSVDNNCINPCRGDFFSHEVLNELSKSLSSMKSLNDMILSDPKLFDIMSKSESNNEIRIIRPKKYKMFSAELKKKCIQLAESTDLKIISKQFQVPLKSLKRWMNVGPERKKGGGRRIKDPQMERRLFEWYKEYHIENNNPVTARKIKSKALEFRTCPDFIASKGWLEKFKRKYKLEIIRESQIKKAGL